MKNWFTLLAVLLTPVCVSAQGRHDVVITEIMADPTPSAGLPGFEWIELLNRSPAPISLLNWRIGDLSGQSGPMPNITLPPDSFIIVCSGSAAAALSSYGRTVSVTSFPSLDNDGDQLFVKAASGLSIHAVAYTSAWYQNELKKEGGWSLEITDPSNPCSGADNWMASNAPNGGTPGKRNANHGPHADTRAPGLMSAYSTDSLTIQLVFDEPVDSLSAAVISRYTPDPAVNVNRVIVIPPLFNRVQLTLSAPMIPDRIYTITVAGITDCAGNSIGSNNQIRTGMPSHPQGGEWIINEILFNPRSNAYDFVEFFNNCNKILDVSRLFIASRDGSGGISSIKALSPVPFYVFPGEYLVVTEEAENLSQHYHVKYPGKVLSIPVLPSFPDEEGTVIALNFHGDVTDEVRYHEDWHFRLLADKEGISLERIDPAGDSQDPDNWHSAASTVGYATPGYVNSQYRLPETIRAVVQVTPRLFSPDNDGRDDVASLQYRLTEPGYVANVVIYDAAGRPVRNLVRNATAGLEGYWNWDGLDDMGQRLPVGTFIFFTELFNLQGKKKQFKNAVVLARNLN